MTAKLHKERAMNTKHTPGDMGMELTADTETLGVQFRVGHNDPPIECPRRCVACAIE